MNTVFAEGFDTGYAHALDKLEQGSDLTGRMSPPEYFWCNALKFDLRDATRGEQEAVRVLFLAQRLDLLGFTERHVELVELVIGRPAYARELLSQPS